MIKYITLLLIYSILATIEFMRLLKQNEILLSNYQNCLRALADADPKLKEYLEKR